MPGRKRKATSTLTRRSKRRRYNTGGYRRMAASQRGYVRTVGFYGAPQEKKYFDVLVNSTMAATGTIIASLNLIDQGNGPDECIGRKIVVKSLQFIGQVSSTTDEDSVLANTYRSYVARWIFYCDRQANGATAAAADIWTTPATATYSPMNMLNTNRFKILKTKYLALNPAVSAYYGAAAASYTRTSVHRAVKFFKRLNIPIEFSPMAGGSRVISEVRSNNLGIALASNNSECSFYGIVRIRYDDS